MAVATARLPTGIEVLDELLDGGIASGSLVVLSAAPASQSERFISRLTDARQTLYLTTVNSESAVRAFLDRTDVDPDTYTVRKVDDESLEDAYRLVRSMSHRSNLVVDTMDALEDANRSEYKSFVNAVRDHLEQIDSLGYLHCLDGRRVPAQRDTTEYMADVVFTLTTEFDGEEIVNRLLVPKVRGGGTVTSALKLDLSEGVAVDTSRDIA